MMKDNQEQTPNEESQQMELLKEAIIDLYLAIKIRSADEVNIIFSYNLQLEKVDENSLEKEK